MLRVSLWPSSMPTFASDVNVLDRLGLIYAGYRIALSFLLILLFLVTVSNPLIGGNAPYLYLQSVAAYCFVTLMSYIVLRHWPFRQQDQIFLMLIIDVTALSMMLYANGGPSLQMSMLYLVVVVAANILLPSVRALSIALLAVITVVWQQFFFALTQQADVRSISGALLLSISFMGVSLLTRQVSGRLALIEGVAKSQAQQVRQLEAINQRIIEQMQTGVLVLDRYLNILLVNQAAQQLLSQSMLRVGQPLLRVTPVLHGLLVRAQAEGRESMLLPQDSQGLHSALGIQIASLDAVDMPSATLLLIEGLERANQQAQQLKLASLGRLTASIAHEIRNPLAAISQASELLEDSMHDPADAELLAIIQKQGRRMNRIIEDVLNMSRRQRATPQIIVLDQWLPHTLVDAFPKQQAQLVVQVQDQLRVCFDPDQLTQVLVNLIQNALYHGAKCRSTPIVRLLASRDSNGQISLDIIDEGPGVTAEARSTLFEPFFTTEPNGTGLGLYLARAFCEANAARLFHVPILEGACFRLVFARTGNAS